MQGERNGMNIQAWPGVLGVPGPEGNPDYSLPLRREQGGLDRWHGALEIPSISTPEKFRAQSSDSRRE